jgi:hypothetical protein
VRAVLQLFSEKGHLMLRLAQVLSAAILVLVWSAPDGAVAKPTHRGKERWSIKTSVVFGARKIAVDLPELLALKDVQGVPKNDARYDSSRITGFRNRKNFDEGDIVTTTGWLHLVAGEPDGDYHIQISTSQTDGGNCLVVEVPKDDPAYVGAAALRAKAKTVRSWIRTKLLDGREPSTKGSVMTHSAFVSVTGQLFYDDAHVGDQPRGKKGMKAATLWELHPVTAMAFAAH